MGSGMGEDEKDAFYVVRKGDIIGVYRSLSECQQQAPSSVTDPPMSVYKGYGWPPPQGAQDLISSFGLKNALFSLNATHLKHDDSSSVFGKLIPCPLQQPSSSSSSYQGESLDKPSQPKRLLQQMETDESSFFPSTHPQKHLKTENSGGGGMVPRPSTQRPILQNDSCSIEFDGASKGNPGKAGAGAVLRSSHDNSVLFYLREGVGTATNNVAEYRALILGLKSALLKGFTNVRVQGDSMLVCMQVQDKWQTKHPKMAELCKQAKDLMKQFKSFQIQHIDRRVVRVLDIAGGVMEELSSPSGPRKDFVNSHCREFMQSIKDIQVTLREEIKSACEYRPFEKSDYNARIANEICFQKLEYVLSQLHDLQITLDHYPSSA